LDSAENEDTDRPRQLVEDRYYKLLVASDPDTVYHFLGQIGFLQPVAREELKCLSKEASRECGSSILDFKSDYPILFEVLDAAFGWMMSNSRMYVWRIALNMRVLSSGVFSLSSRAKMVLFQE
jgi:hypothetical protein